MSGAASIGRLRPPVALATASALAAGVWVAAGPSLPGGRWLAVHLFTLGVVTNLVLALSQRFAENLTRGEGSGGALRLALANAGTVTVLWGIPTGAAWAVVAGAAAVTAAVLLSYARLRRLRRNAPEGARFAWIVRMYERAHGAFVHGAFLGALLGAGALAGAWRASGRLAHLHVNVLGWGGLTLLATLAFFGPTMVRARIEPGADARAAVALRWGASGLHVGVFALLGSGAAGAAGVALRLVSAGALGVFAWSATVTCLPVVRTALRAKRSGQRPLVGALASWFVAAAWADVGVVATGSWRLLDALGLAFLVGVLAQAIVAALGYFAPLLRGGRREAVRRRLDRGGGARAAAWNLGVSLVVAGALAPALGAVPARVGWGLVVASAVWALGAALAPEG